MVHAMFEEYSQSLQEFLFVWGKNGVCFLANTKKNKNMAISSLFAFQVSSFFFRFGCLDGHPKNCCCAWVKSNSHHLLDEML